MQKDSAPLVPAKGASRFGSVVAVDFETFYDSRSEYSLRVMTPYNYVRDARFDPYMVSIVGETGEEFVGDPLGFDWRELNGATLLMHNAGFDGMVLNRLIELGKVPEFERDLVDTADMCSFMCTPRSLAKACKVLLGLDVSKVVRTGMDGRHFSQLDPADKEALYEYALDDSRLCLSLYQRFSDQWPQWERDVSKLNREATWRGIALDIEAAKAGLLHLTAKQEAAAQKLPWTEAGIGAGSRPQFLTYIKDLGLPVPKSLAKNDPAFRAWVEKYKDQCPLLQARIDVASLGTHVSRLKAMISRADSDGILRYASLYFGSHTGRCSGSARRSDEAGKGRANLYNMPKGDEDGKIHGVDIRGLHIPRPGHTYLIYDYGQIEPRVLQWFAGNSEFLARISKENVYQAAAKTLGWYPASGTDLKGDDVKMYALSKACTLGLGFGMGATKFVQSCETQDLHLVPCPKAEWVVDRRTMFTMRNVARLDWKDPEQEAAVSAFMASDKIVTQWRAANPLVVAFWRKLEDALRDAAERRTPVHYFTLPSGRRKPYWQPQIRQSPKIVLDPETGQPEQKIESRLSAFLVLGDIIPKTLHGGPLTENLVQATARDIMFHGALGVVEEAPQWHYMFNIYDELVFEVPTCDAESAQQVIPELLTSGPMLSWARGLPLEVEGGPADRYTKHDDRWRKHSGVPG